MEDNKKKGFGMVLEGGGMRGLYTAGVLDELTKGVEPSTSAMRMQHSPN